MVLLSASVYVCAAVQKQFDEIEHGSSIDAFIHTMIQIHIANIDGCPQRRAAPKVLGVNVRAMIEEKLGHIEVIIQDGHEQRLDLVGIGKFHIAAGGDYGARRFKPAVTSGVQQWCHSTIDSRPLTSIRNTSAVNPYAF